MKLRRSVKNVSVYDYDNYRNFLSDRLAAMGFSQRVFALRFPGVISRIALAKLLACGRGKQKREAAYNISLEKLGQLARALHLNEDEIQYLLVLKLENDTAILPAQFGATSQRAMKKLLEALSQSRGQTKSEVVQDRTILVKKHDKISQLEKVALLLPPPRQQKILEKAIDQLKIHLSRHQSKPGLGTHSEVLRDIQFRI